MNFKGMLKEKKNVLCKKKRIFEYYGMCGHEQFMIGTQKIESY